MSPSIYVSFFVLTLALVALDIYQTRGGQISIRKAAIWSVFWFLLAFAFSATIYLFWDFYAPASDYTAKKGDGVFLNGLLIREIAERG